MRLERDLLSRRGALKAGLAGLSAAVYRRHLIKPTLAQEENPYFFGGRVNVYYDETISFNEYFNYPPMLGRVESWYQKVVAEVGNYNSETIRTLVYSEVVPIYEVLHATPRPGFPHNDIWYDVGDGYVHSSWVVPCKEEYHIPEELPENGFWGEISVPTSWQHWKPVLNSPRYYDMAHGAVFRVIDKAVEEDGRVWYRIFDDLIHGSNWWVQAAHVRRVQPEELTPISTGVPFDQKHIEVNVTDQTLTCFEYGAPVFSTRCATGATFYDSEGNAHSFHTPWGTHKVILKTHSTHMVGGDTIDDHYDLPGVPWCTYFTFNGAAIHGCYWHNDYGIRRSHGCVNLTNEDSKWVYRWATPASDYWHNQEFFNLEMRKTSTKIVVYG